jgi:hypothetical protein
MSNNFIVLGTPRSGTTFFCQTLSQLDDVFIPEFPNFEIFNPWATPTVSKAIKTHMFDQDKALKKFIDYKIQINKKYFGFKTFIPFHNDLTTLINNNDLDIFVVLRKDIWKILGSMLIAIDHNDYTTSSLKYQPFVFEKTEREKRRVLGLFNQLCKSFWYNENAFTNHKNFVEKIYLEDIVAGNNTFKNVNNYFNKIIEFYPTNNDNKSINEYISNIDEFQSFFKDHVKKSKEHYGALPEYILKELDL